MFTEPKKKQNNTKFMLSSPEVNWQVKGNAVELGGHSYFFQLGLLYVTASSRKVEIRELMGSLLGVRDWDACNVKGWRKLESITSIKNKE